MEEKPYQNIDLPQSNPLDVATTKKSISPKILLLIVLAATTFVLLLLSLVINQNNSSTTSSISPVPTSALISTIPTNSDSLIPSPYQKSFQDIDQSLSQDPDLPVPQIDTTVGL